MREEGELTSSSSDDHALPPPPPQSSRVPPSPTPSGKLNSVKAAGRATEFRSQEAYHKGFSKDKTDLKSSNSGWHAAGTNDNLIISFSDDDNGSDAEERRKENNVTRDRPPLVLKSNRKPPALPHVKMHTLSRTAKNEGKIMPPKVSTHRTFTSSMTKIQESSAKSGAFALAEQTTGLKGFNVPRRSLANPDPGNSKNLDMSDSKLEDLRQQIVARENELKLKPVQQNKVISYREADVVSQRKVPSRKCKSVPVSIQDPPKEPERKRLRTNDAGVAVSRSLSEWVSLPKQTASLMNPTLSDSLENSRPGVISKNQPSRSAPNQDIHDSNMSKANDNWDSTSALKKSKSTSASFQDHSLQVSPYNTSLLLHLGRSTALTNGDVDLQSLFDVDELHDKELEEAQELRQMCEVEERYARNAYHRAQRALLEANARCTFLYRKRELYSAQLRSFLTEDSSLLYSSRQHQDREVKWDAIPTNHQLDVDAHNRSSANEDGYNIGYEACSEPDASTSEPKYIANGTCSPFVDPNVSPVDDYETFPMAQRSLDSKYSRSKGNVKEVEKDTEVYSAKDVSRDPLCLEEYLRSKLISRLGVSSLKHSGIGDNGESSARSLEEGIGGAKTDTIVPSVSLLDPNTSATECRADLKDAEGIISKPLSPIQNRQVDEHNFNDSFTSNFNSEECKLTSVDLRSNSYISSAPIIKSVMKAAGLVMFDSMQIREQQTSDTCYKDKSCSDMACSAEQLRIYTGFGKIDSYTSNCAVNPFWPLCIYELQGRCNNNECPWQHAKDYTDSDGCQSGLASNCQTSMGQTEVSCILTPPRYIVCLDSLKDESHTYGSLKDCYYGSSGKYIFSNSLAVSSSVLKHIPSKEPCLHGNDGCVESYGANGNSLYFQSRSIIGKNRLQNGVADNDQFLEMALIVLNQEVNKFEGVKKALNILSRALEADPSFSPIWIIYLILYSSTKYSYEAINKEDAIQDEDLFSYAVKHSEESYELWLMYINSRGHLDERLSAYDRALSSLCYYPSSTSDGRKIHKSAVILDLFLQMLYSFCVSGNFTKALKRIHRLLHANLDSDESHSLLFSDIIECLTISDKCLFWVCCVYLVVYRKLPDSIVQQFECEKNVSSIEWPSVDLTIEEKKHVSKLMEMARESTKSLQSSTTLQTSLLLAMNHIKLTIAIDGVESCKLLLEKYHNSYSCCLEFILILARANDFMGDKSSLEKFEELTRNWPKDISGSQCIWNQFAELALMKGKYDRAKELMDHWFHSDGMGQLFENRLLSCGNSDKSISTDPHSVLNLGNQISNYSNMDLVFGLLNLSLYKLFHNDVIEAYSAIDRALKVSDSESLMHCVKEHAAFLFYNGSQLMKDSSIHGLIGILKGYMICSVAIPIPEPLTRSFTEDIQKPRTKQLVQNILTSILPDSSWVNSVLEIWFGSSLLPEKFDQIKDLVDYVEVILELSPANYRLAISVCKLIYQDCSNSKSESVLFWASSLLVNTIYHAIPHAPEHVWVEAADLLVKLKSVDEICDSFQKRALSVHPFSVKLWKSFLNHSTQPSKRSSLIAAVREKGLQFDEA